MPTVKKPRAHNLEDWKHPDWVETMISKLAKQKRFRWFDSGDCYDRRLAEKLYLVMKALPDCEFWLPTRMHKFDKFKPVLAKMARLPNVVVRKSSDGVNGERTKGKNTSTIIQHPGQAKGAHICPKTEEGKPNNCKGNNCYSCWDKSVPVIAYIEH